MGTLFLRAIAVLKRNKRTISISLGLLFLGGLLGWVSAYWVFSQDQAPHPLRQSSIPSAISEYRYIDPLIGTGGASDSPKHSLLERDIKAYIAEQQKEGLITASVLFRDINDVSGFTINPTETYTPASLFKVPVMMAYFKAAETDPTIFSDRVTYTGSNDRSLKQEIKPSKELSAGSTYTVTELLTYMIVYSDNNAADLLRTHLVTTNHLDAYALVFSDLGIDPKTLLESSESVTIQKYIIFFRALYNATYLSRSDSEKALELLVGSDFKDGIASTTPTTIPIAHKFGEARMVDESGTFTGKQLHDCGIVYYPKHPYLLCVMTKGQGESTALLADTIATIARMSYAHMHTLYR